MSTQTGDPKLHNSVKRRRGDNAGEHFAFFNGAFVVGKQWNCAYTPIKSLQRPDFKLL